MTRFTRFCTAAALCFALTARAHRKEVDDNADLRHRAEQEVLSEKQLADAGEAPADARLQGAWTSDLDGTIEAMVGDMPAELKQKMKAEMGKALGPASYS